MKQPARFLTDSLPAGVYRLPEELHEHLQAEASQLGLRWESLNLEQTTLSAALLAAGKTLQLPDWYGANLDALYDCLCDAEIFPAQQGFIIRLAQLALANEAIIDVLSDVVAARNAPGQPAWVLLPPAWTRYPILPGA